MAAPGQWGNPIGRGKSGLHGNTAPDNVRRGRPQGKCHRKQTARTPLGRRCRVRVKGCGKSAPPPWRHGGHGKPRREQDRIGTAIGFGPKVGFRIAVRVGRVRPGVTPVPEEWPSPWPRRALRRALRAARTEPGLQTLWPFVSSSPSGDRDRLMMLHVIVMIFPGQPER